MTKRLEKIGKLIEKGNNVLKTSKPNPPNVIAPIMCDSQLFTTWRTQTLNFLENYYTISSAYYSEFLKVSKPYVTHIKVGLGVLNAIKEELDENLDENIEEKNEKALLTLECNSRILNKIFISHATKDKLIVEELIEILESMGIDSTQIFCSSFEGYGIPLGANFLDQIKQELSSDVLVLFVLTENFYDSKICLCEMGAAWALSKQHIPIFVPPLSYQDIQGIIPLTQGLMINDASKLNSFKERLETLFELKNPLSIATWERKRDRFIRDVNTHLSGI